MKTCTHCNQEQSDSEFHSHPTTKDGLQSRCKACSRSAVRDHMRSKRKTDPAFRFEGKAKNLPKDINFGFKDYLKLNTNQDRCCAVCQLPETVTGKSGEVRDLVVNYSEVTNEVRGLLCLHCTTRVRQLEFFQENPEYMKRAQEFLNSDRKLTEKDPTNSNL